ncbi:MAG: 2-succinyl-5-enolpyruvyl-6-hydroxy-3-cyclohexene-1-carboxylate synthase, partial [Propionibacteriaceae bacterium]|nr:2-succinyl-5-enolpyruvyl-6-hydroxy-3-cyclohexene-1-carboxylate synthase [Propionibacteriaceae bacterium]
MDQADQKVSPAALCGAVLIDELAALGVTDVVLCPGARSAPLAQAAFAAQKDGLLNLWVRIDERSAGFFALGLAKATWRATALVVTSGTAVANLLPALLEARHTRAPLIALTADRPATLVGTGANQTTDQLVLLRGAVRSVIRVSSADARPEAWRQAVRRALVTAEGRLDRRMGPVQINVELTPPLTGASGPLPSRRPFHCPDRPPEGVVTVVDGPSDRFGAPAQAADG